MSLRIEQTTIFNPPHPTTLVATISNLEGLLFFEGQILMQKHAVASGEWGREGDGGGGTQNTILSTNVTNVSMVRRCYDS